MTIKANELRLRRSVFFKLRAALCFVILALLVFHRETPSPLLWVLGIIFLVSTLILRALPASWFKSPSWGYAVFLLDLVGITVILYWLAGLGSDTVLLFYLTVLIATLSEDVARSVGIAFGASALYVWLHLKSRSPLLGDPTSLIRIPLFLITAVFCGYLAQELRRHKRQVKELQDIRKSLQSEVGSISEELARSEESRGIAHELARRFRTLLEDLNAVVWEMDVPTFQITFVSQQAERLLGYPVENWLTEKDFWTKHIYSNDRERVEHAFQKALAEGSDYDLDYRALAADGKVIWVRDVVRVVRDDSGRIRRLRGVLVDITDHKQLEEEFRQAQKMEAVGRLAGGVAHDFNNMLTIVDGYSQLGLDRLDSNDPLHGYFEEIHNASRRATALTRRLLTFSRRQVLQPQRVDLNALIAELQGMLRRLIGEDIELKTNLQPGVGTVRVDPAQIEQVIMNLAVNARDAMPRGGKLIIETAQTELDDSYAQNHVAVKAGSYVMLAVNDTGVGMDAETQTHIFEPFFTTKEKGKGTGLGLATVYGIVKQSGGNVWVYSERGRGTTFKIYFPRTTEVPEAIQPVVHAVMPLGGTETILVVEDENEVRALVRKSLASVGYSVLEADRPDIALRTSKEYRGKIHLLLTDVVMPQMNGRELAERLTALRPEMKVLYMSGYTDAAIHYYDVLGPSHAFLQKPFTPNVLGRRVREVLGAARTG